MSEMATNFGRLSTHMTKIEKYGWKIKDAKGEIVNLHKSRLQIHPAYQRNAIKSKIKAISSAWSWIACGAIIVGERDGEYWVIDGQHRVIAAKNRSDIDVLPCILFHTESVEQEARGFLDANTGRKPVSSIDKFRASLAAGDDTAKYVDSVFSELGIIVKGTAKNALEIKSVAVSIRWANENREAFDAVIRLSAELCQHCPIHEVLLGGLYYVYVNSENKFNDKRLIDRIKSIGAERLVYAGKRAAAYYVRGGLKVWADGMMEELNKGLRKQIKFVDKK